MPSIRFTAKPLQIGDWTILRLPETASIMLSSRGMALVEGTINGFHSKIVLEPDGRGSHWFRVNDQLRKDAEINTGDKVTLEVEPSKAWPEPEVPSDLSTALVSDKKANVLWMEITPMARWDWIRWIRSTNSQETRQKRIKVALSKLNAGERRPCCFNRNQCTEPDVSKSGVLIEPIQVKK
jgi:hypothetical protein